MSQRLPSHVVLHQHQPSPSATQPLTSSEKRKATIRARRKDQRRQEDEVLAETLPPRQAKLAAQKKSVWINNDATRKKKHPIDNNTQVQPPRKQVRRNQTTSVQHTAKYDDVDNAIIHTNAPPMLVSHTAATPPVAVGTKKCCSRKVSSCLNDSRRPPETNRNHKRAPVPLTKDPEATDDEVDPIEDFDDDSDSDDHQDHSGQFHPDNSSDSDPIDEGDSEDLEEFDYPMKEELTWKAADTRSDNTSSDGEVEDQRLDEVAQDAAGSDSELEYAQEHGISRVSKKHTNVNALFDDDVDVHNGHAVTRLPHQAPRSKKSSRRAQRLTKEAPKWEYPKPGPLPIVKGRKAQRSSSHTTRDPEPGSGTDDEDAANYGDKTRVAWTKRGNIAISRSSAEMQGCFHDVANRCKLHLIRRDAFPEAVTLSQKRQIVRHHWLRVSEEKKAWDPEGEIYSRVGYDEKFFNGLYDAMSTRMSLFRGKFKTAACKKLPECLGLGAHTPKNDEWAASLLVTKHYIFPVKAKRTSDLSKPFENPIIAEVMKEVLGSRRQGWITEYIWRFKVKSGTSYTYEMPKAVVALAATAVEAALRDYCSRSSQPSEFSAEVYGSVYSAHLIILDRQQQKKNPQHHRLMAKLYSDTFETENPAQDVATANVLWSDIEWDEVEYH